MSKQEGKADFVSVEEKLLFIKVQKLVQPALCLHHASMLQMSIAS